MYGRITFSNVFAIADRRDIGLYDVPMLMSLLGLGIGMILVVFDIVFHNNMMLRING